MKRTPLYEKHLSLKGKMVDYAGWEMPVQYSGISEETLAVRNDVGIFDVSHMGEIYVKGQGSADFLDYMLTRKISGKKPEVVTYNLLCYEDGGTVDDLLNYQMGENWYMLVVNAANKDKDFKHINDSLDRYFKEFPENSRDIEVIDMSDQYGQVAVQGPNSPETFLKVAKEVGLNDAEIEEIKAMKRFRRILVNVPGEELDMVISRTGYTGEIGYELYVPRAITPRIWDLFVNIGVTPCGLGSRDALRLEAGLPLYGHEISADLSPIEGGMGIFVKFDHKFQGDVMKDRQKRKTIGLVSQGKAIARDNYDVFYDGEKVGYVTSGSFSPYLGKGIAFASVELSFPDDATEAEVLVRKHNEKFTVVETPFVRK